MKNLKSYIAIVVFSIATVTSVAAKNIEPSSEPNAVTKALRADIVKLLGHHSYELNNQIIKAEITVMVNNQNEIVVISVDSKNKIAADFATKKLNYKKVSIKGLQKGSMYTIPLTIE